MLLTVSVDLKTDVAVEPRWFVLPPTSSVSDGLEVEFCNNNCGEHVAMILVAINELDLSNFSRGCFGKSCCCCG